MFYVVVQELNEPFFVFVFVFFVCFHVFLIRNTEGILRSKSQKGKRRVEKTLPERLYDRSFPIWHNQKKTMITKKTYCGLKPIKKPYACYSQKKNLSKQFYPKKFCYFFPAR